MGKSGRRSRIVRCRDMPSGPARRHQQSIGADVIVLLADYDVLVVLVTRSLDPAGSFLAPIGLVHEIGPRERIVDRRDVVVQKPGITLVEVNPLVQAMRRTRWRRSCIGNPLTADALRHAPPVSVQCGKSLAQPYGLLYKRYDICLARIGLHPSSPELRWTPGPSL